MLNVPYLGTGKSDLLFKYHNMKQAGVMINLHSNFTASVDGSV